MPTGKPTTAAPAFSDFAGAASCTSCHQDIFKKHKQTGHYASTSLPTEASMLGSFKQADNTYAFNANTLVRMQKLKGEFYQVAYHNGQAQKSEKIDMVVGSGRKGQSYLTYHQNQFAQLPITYFTPAAQWANSPGYPPYQVVFDRPVTARCLECHTTFVEQEKNNQTKAETFDSSKIIYGVDCQSCHGPAAKHVAYQAQNPAATQAKFIVNPAKLSRQQNLDLCSLCHGGRLQKTAPSFSFQPGDSLANYFDLTKNLMAASDIDVHGNQAGLLFVSKCFERSELTCNNCHSAHEKESGNTALFSQRCQTCHNGQQKICPLTKSIGPAITQNCIDCHMPKQASHSIAVYLQGADRRTPVTMRTHWVKIYPEETEKVKAFLRNARAGSSKPQDAH